MYQLIQKRKYAYWFSCALMVVSIAALSMWGLRLGLDFRGGTLMEVNFESGDVPSSSTIQDSLSSLGVQSLTLQPTGERGLLVRYLASDEKANDQVLLKLRSLNNDLTLVKTDFIGGSVSDQIKHNAFQAVAIAIISIAIYIGIAFRRVSRPVSSWEYGLYAVVALVHDVLLTLGFFAVAGHFFDIEVNAPFIAALLTILGFSVHDTIVVYDRIRENLLRLRVKEDFETTVNRSLNETLARSLNTSFTVLFVLAALLIFGGESIRSFSLALFVGIASGAYSSFYIASALLVTHYRYRLQK
jgi:preprotein translocase subunit SecF